MVDRNVRMLIEISEGRLHAGLIQVVAKAGVERLADPGIRMTSADTFLRELSV